MANKEIFSESFKAEFEKAIWTKMGIKDPKVASELECKKFLLFFRYILEEIGLSVRIGFFVEQIARLESISDYQYDALSKLSLTNKKCLENFYRITKRDKHGQT